MKKFNLKESQYKAIFVLLALGILFAFFDSLNLLGPIKKPAQLVTVPVQYSLYQVRQSFLNGVSTAAGIGNLRAENIQLETENAILVAENERLKTFEQENQILRDQLGATPARAQNLIVAKVIGESPLVSKKLILIDKGEINGVEKGMFVVIRNIFVGQVFEVSARSASVQLISDPENEIAAITSGKVKGLVVGSFGAQAELTQVVQGETLSEGELVITTGEGGYPRGLVLGRIKEVRRVEKELFQKATLEPLVDPSTISTVFVVEDL